MITCAKDQNQESFTACKIDFIKTSKRSAIPKSNPYYIELPLFYTKLPSTKIGWDGISFSLQFAIEILTF